MSVSLHDPEIVLGPPGCGKTTTLLRIVEDELASGTPPDRIGYVSFTRRAADEAIARACERFRLTRRDLPHFRTLHSLCFRGLGLSSRQVLEGQRLQEFGDVVGMTITGRFSLDDGTVYGFEPGDRILFMENLARVRGQDLRAAYDEDSDDLSFWEVERFAAALRHYKDDLGVLDYTDMLQQFVAQDIRVPLDVLLVDEGQDLSTLQWRVVEQLARGARRVVVAGDDDQAIYRWAGADVDTFVGMEGRTRVLSQSWRVPRAVQGLAGEVVRRICTRRPKEWSPREEDGAVTWHPSIDSVDLSGPDVLVLARNRYLLREYERRVRSAGYLYEFQGISSIRPKLLEAVLSWERLRQGRGHPVTVADARRMYEMMSVGRGFARGHKLLPGFSVDDEQVTMAALQERGGLLVSPEALWFDALDKMAMSDVAYIRATRRRGENLLARPRIRLSTIHGMKGGEADSVILMTDMAQRTARDARRWPDDEHRVWYVAVTRARSSLHVVAPSSPRNYSLGGQS